MIKFILDKNKNKAFIYKDVGSEDGWIFSYSNIDGLFSVWSNGEKQALGKSPEFFCNTLEEVLELVSKFT